MISHLVVPQRQDLVSLTAALLDSRFTIERLTLVEWSADKLFVLKEFCQPRGIKLNEVQWHNWHQKVDSNSAWLIADKFDKDGWHAEQQALNLGLTITSIQDDNLYWLANTEEAKKESALDLADNLTLEHYFPLFNWRVKSLDRNKISDSHKSVAEQWRKKIKYGRKALAQLNYLATTCNADLRTTLDRHQQCNGILQAFIDELVASGMASYYGKYLTF